MATLELKGIRKSFGATEVIRNMNLDVQDGELIVFVGPSGCGKSTMLRMIAGLETLSAGQISIGGKRVDHLPPTDRGIAMVFQSYALYPHKNVRGNLGFALKHAGVDKKEIDERVNNASEILGLSDMMERKPRELSGGQRQRVAIGRAIVREPDVFLFDEPLSNLDAALRVHMRVEILKLHQRLGNTMVYVTHDQVEAMTLANRIVVFRDGVVEQVGTPLELYRNPVNAFVAGFIGSPAMNFLEANVADFTVTVAGTKICFTPAANGAAKLGLRPEHLMLSDDGPFKGTVSVFEHLGGESFLHMSLPDKQMLVAKLDGERSFAPGEACSLGFRPEHCHVFDMDGGRISK
jgi:multiple sugar transport system ATP-binding protein